MITPKFILTIFTSLGVAPAALWALVSIITRILNHPISISFRVYQKMDVSQRMGFKGDFGIHAFPVSTSLCVLVGAALIIYGINSIPPSR